MRILQATPAALRRVRVLAGLLMAAALFLIPAATPPVTQALGKIIAQQNISNTETVQSEAPQISVGGDFLGASWGERTEQKNGKVALNTTTIGTTFSGLNTFNVVGTQIAYQWPDIAVDANGTSHIAYIEANTIYYKSKPKNGSISSPKFVANSDFPNPVRIAVGSDGVIWVVWRNSSGSSIFYKRSTDGGTRWINGNDGGIVATQSGNMKSPDVAVGPDNIAHVVWFTVGSGDIRVADWAGTNFTTSSITTDGAGAVTFDEDPSITIDGQNVQHIVYRKKLNANGTSYGITYARRPSGQSPNLFTTVATTDGDAKYAPAIGSDEKGNLYITYSNPINGKQRQVIFWGKTPTGQWDGPLPMPLVSWDSRNAVTGRNGDAHILYQTELRSDQGEIQYVRVAFASGASIGATPKINATVNQDPVSVAFENVVGDPKEIRWRWGAAPTDAANDSGGWQGFTNPKPIGLPANVDKTACQNLTLYTQVRNGTVVQTTASPASFQFDKAAQANVAITNPFLAGLPKTFGAETSDPYTSATDGAYDGDPGYTRVAQFFLSINNNNDCSGLASFIIPVSSTSDVIANGSYQKPVTMPQGSFPNPPAKIRIDTIVSDRLGNITSYPSDIVYDPANTNQGGTPNTDGLPVLANGGSATVDSVNSIIRKLTFQNISVNDTAYGQFENLQPGRQFWGAWIANSTTPVANPNSANLQWFPVHVLTPSSGFTLTWNLFNGIAPEQRVPGTYYIYVKFLDGAGNATIGTLPAVQAQLSAGFSVPTLYLPQIGK